MEKTETGTVENIYLQLNLDPVFSDNILSFSDRYAHWRRIHSLLDGVDREIRRKKQRKVNVLDIGCGQGYFCLKLAGMYPDDVAITGIDVYGPATVFAEAKRDFRRIRNCSFAVMDARKLSFEDCSFDLVVCSEVIEHLPDPELLVRELSRVMRRDAVAFITSPNKRKNFFFGFLRRLIVGARREENVPQPSYMHKAQVYHVSVKTWREWRDIFAKEGLRVRNVRGTGGIYYNNSFWESHRFLFGLMVMLDSLLEHFPFSQIWSEIAIFKLKKTGCRI